MLIVIKPEMTMLLINDWPSLNLFSMQNYSIFPVGFFLVCKIATYAVLFFKQYHSDVESQMSYSENLDSNPSSSTKPE